MGGRSVHPAISTRPRFSRDGGPRDRYDRRLEALGRAANQRQTRLGTGAAEISYERTADCQPAKLSPSALPATSNWTDGHSELTTNGAPTAAQSERIALAAVVLRVLPLAAVAARRQAIGCVVQVHCPPAIGATVTADAWLLSDVMHRDTSLITIVNLLRCEYS